MTTGSVTRPEKRGRLQRLRKIFSHSSTAAESHPPSASPETANPIRSKPRSSGLSGTRSSCRSEKSDLGARPLSPTGQTTSPAQGCPASTLGRDLLGRALQLLEERERVIIQGYLLPSTDDIASALEEAFNAAQEKQKVCESKRWTFTWGKHSIRLWDEADKVILWLDRFKQVGDIAVNADPIHAGLPWAGIRLLLEATISESRQMAALLTGLKTTLYMMNRLKAYWEYLRELPETQSRTNFETALTELHAIILQFLARAIQIYQKSSLSRGFDAFWKPDEVSNFDSECDKIAARAETEASNCDRTLSAVEREEANQRKEHLQRVLKELEELRGIEESVNMLANKIDLTGLPSVDGAAFNSYDDELDARCHPDTRIDLLRQIKDWADDPQSKCILWLNGMAGTGKSTISRTVAQSFADVGQLGASFFFKRGEGERGNASRFFTTIAVQLVRTVPAMVPYVRKAIDADPGISGRLMKEQFENLIFQPLSEVGQISVTMLKLVIVIDALDECEREGDIRNILYLLSQTRQLQPIHIRIFLTSRPELPVRLGFKKMSAHAHQDVILQDIPKVTIAGDISSFLKAEFKKIRDNYNDLHPDSSLPQDWPSEQCIQALAEMAVPLFIFAATVSRFVGDHRWNPKRRLADVLKYQMNGQASKLEKTYLPVLDHLLANLSDPEQEDLVREFQAVVGSIVVLAEPLGTSSLARLLNIAKETIDCRLDSLHSVLNIPLNPDFPIRLLHLSFREFLLDPYKRGKSPFWVDERERHGVIAARCLELMSERLSENICHLEFPGKPRGDIDRKRVEKYLPADVRYACRYWVHHFVEAKRLLGDQDAVHTFLQKHFLHWLEALSLIGRISDSIAMIGNLQSIIAADGNTEISYFLSDAKRFILQNRWIIDIAPLQLYSSAIIFAPIESVIRAQFERPIQWICRLPKVPPVWSLELQKLEGHSNWVNSVAFSHDSQLLASASSDRTVRLWNPATGVQVQELEGHSDWVNAVAFSHDSQLLASASNDWTVRLWNPVTGEQVQKLGGHSNCVNSVAFSHDDQLLASASDDWTVRLWNLSMGEQVQDLKGHSYWVNAVAFSHDSQLLASASNDSTVRLWNPATGEQVQILEGHSDWVNAVAFSYDGQLLASASDDRTVRLWNPATGEQVQTLKQNVIISQLRFSTDSQYLESDKGILCHHSHLSTVLSPTPKLAGHIFLNGDWITRDGRNLLWLPYDYRGACSALRGNLLAIGQSSGLVHFIEFSSLSAIV